MGNALCSTSDGASMRDYLAYLAGDDDFELTFYGVRKTESAIERDIRINERRLGTMVEQREKACAELETRLATARETAIRQGEAAKTAPGGIKGIVAQTALSAARAAVMQMMRVNEDLRQEYTRLEAGRAALAAIRARSSVQNDVSYYNAIHTSLDEARLHPEQLAMIQAASQGAVLKFAALEPQNVQYNTIMDTFESSLQVSNAKSVQSQLGNYNLADNDSLLSALDSLRADSYCVSTALGALDALPPVNTAAPGTASQSATSNTTKMK
jgi:hypothetical protein